MNKYDEAIEIIERMMFAFATTKVDGIHIYPTLKIAIEALQQAKECENPQPLTIEQLKKRVGKPVWDNFKKEWFILNDLFEDEETKIIDWLEATDEEFHGFNIDEHRYYDHELKGEK